MRTLFFVLLTGILFACNSQDTNKKQEASTQTDSNTVNTGSVVIAPEQITAEQIPKTIRLRGTVWDSWQWKDKLGDNILVMTWVDPYTDKKIKNEFGEEGKTSELYAYHYVNKDTGYQLLWKISDGEKGCPFDITSDFIKRSITVTDLNNNGVVETVILYKLACRSDVSPAYMKLIMHEGTNIYSLKGNMWVQTSPEEKFTVTENDVNLERLPKKSDEYEAIMQSFGRYETEKEFDKAPPQFLPYARVQWMKFVKESFE